MKYGQKELIKIKIDLNFLNKIPLVYHSNSYIGTLELNINIISKYSNTTYLYSYKTEKLEIDFV